MRAVRRVVGRALPIERANVDTDQIIPAHWLKRVERTGYGAGLFEAWRRDPAFVMNDPRYAGASILIAGANFGSGSSREHAVWALDEAGFRAVVAPRLADIFRASAPRDRERAELAARDRADLTATCREIAVPYRTRLTYRSHDAPPCEDEILGCGADVSRGGSVTRSLATPRMS